MRGTAPAASSEAHDQPDDRDDAGKSGRIAERPWQGVGNGKRDVFPNGVRAVGIRALDPGRRWLNEQCDRAQRDRCKFEATL